MNRCFLGSLLLLSLLYACKSPDKELVSDSAHSSMDSLKFWLEAGRNKSNSNDLRFKQLAKLDKSVDTISNDSIKISFLSEISLAYSSLNEISYFNNANNKLITFAEQIKDSVRLAEAFWDKGAFYDSPKLEIRDSAYFYFKKAQNIYQLLGDDVSTARVLRSMASVQTEVHDNTGAMVNLTRAIELLKPYDEDKRLYEAYNTMGIASSALNEFKEALEYYELANEYLNSAQLDKRLLASLENNVGLVYFKMGDYHSAKKFYQQALDRDSLFILNPSLYAKVLDHLAMTDFNLGELDSVEDNLYRSQYIRDSIGDLEGLSLNYYNLALVNKEIGRKADAFIFAGNSRDLAREIDNNYRYLESLKLLAELDPDNALKYNQEYITLNEQLQLEERRVRNKFERIRFETEETESRNAQLARQRVIWISIAAGLLLFAVALSIIVIQRIKNQKLLFQQQQQEANQEIFNLMLSQKQKVEEGKQSEQKRISEELHDGILGEMNGVRMILLGLNKKGDEAAVSLREQAIEKLKDIQEEIRSISHELNDSSYQKFNNFMNSIDDLLRNSCQSAGIQYHFSYDQDLDWDQLEGFTKINLYRILQESLQNCLKHAEATSIYVSFEIDGSQIVITIQDNGKGFDSSKGKKGIGHKNIGSRVRKIQGKWYLKSAPGIGTTVLVEIPMESISQEAKKEISLPKDLQEA